MNNKKYTIFSIVILFFLSVLIMLRQLTSSDYFSNTINDTFTYTSWAWQFTEALKEGIIYPRWMPLNFWDYGSPVFILYPPLAFYLVSFFNIFTDSVTGAMNICKFVALFLTSIGMFFLIKEFYSEKVALLSASFSIVFPYSVSNVYISGAFASTISLIWFPLIILFTYRYIKNRHYTQVIYAGACYSGLILTHLVNAYMFSFVLIAFILYVSIIQKRLKDVIVVPLIPLTGLLLSAAYVLPLVFEKQFVNLEAFIGEGFHFAHFFILPKMTNKFSSDHFWVVYYNEAVFYVFLFCIFIFLFFFKSSN